MDKLFEQKSFDLVCDRQSGFAEENMNLNEIDKEEWRRSLSKPLNKRMTELLSAIERNPALFLGNEANIRCLYHFLNGWQMAACENRNHEEVSLNEKMNAFLALKYEDYDTLNWEDLLIRHEGEDAAFRKFFEFFHLMDNQ